MGIKKGKEGRDDRAEGLSLRRSKQMAGVTPFAEDKPGRESLSAYERPRVWRGACQGSEIKLSMKNAFLSPRQRDSTAHYEQKENSLKLLVHRVYELPAFRRQLHPGGKKAARRRVAHGGDVRPSGAIERHLAPIEDFQRQSSRQGGGDPASAVRG